MTFEQAIKTLSKGQSSDETLYNERWDAVREVSSWTYIEDRDWLFNGEYNDTETIESLQSEHYNLLNS